MDRQTLSHLEAKKLLILLTSKEFKTNKPNILHKQRPVLGIQRSERTDLGGNKWFSNVYVSLYKPFFLLLGEFA